MAGFANPVVTSDRLIVVGPTAPTTFTLLFSNITRTSVTAAETAINTFLAANVTDRALLCRVKALNPLRLSMVAYDIGNPRGIDLDNVTG